MRPGRALRFEPAADANSSASSARARVVVLDTTWTPRPGDPRETVRDAAERVLTRRDLFDEATGLLDDWAQRSGIVDLLTVDGTSFWYLRRLSHWWWLHERLLWLGIVDALLGDERPSAIELGAGGEEALAEVLALMGSREDLAIVIDAGGPEPSFDEPSSEPAPLPPRARRKPSAGRSGLARLVRRLRDRYWPEPHERRMRAIARRLEQLERRRPALLVLLEHARQRVETDRGPRQVNPYLDPILDELATTPLEHVDLELTGSIDDEVVWQRLSGRNARRLLPVDVLRLFDRRREQRDFAARADEMAERVATIDAPLVVAGVDLGPALTARLVEYTRSSLRGRIRNVTRMRRLLARLRPVGIMLADEYNRTDWLAAARAEGVPTIAIQHGGIQRRHMGYIHTTRPATLRLADRTYVFGEWERRLLIESSVYREDEVRVAGSPRLGLVPSRVASERDAVRSELGVTDGARLLVVSTTWGPLLRRFHFPVSLARVFDRPMPDLHVVIKLHPGEPDDGLYRRVIENVADAFGFEPPPMTVVHRIDLYRLLAAADAHLGLYSTVITEAVFTGTPNLLAAAIQPRDLLGYVEAGVAIPVRDGEEMLQALASGAGRSTSEAREAFVRDHFEPGNASRRITEELVAWLTRRHTPELETDRR